MGDAAFWARKRLAPLPKYRIVDASVAATEAMRLHLTLPAGEWLLGYYVNPPGTAPEMVAFTSNAIAVKQQDHWDRMEYATLESIGFTGGQADWDFVTLVARDGTHLVVTMVEDVAKPVCDLSGFLMKVSSAHRVFDRNSADVPIHLIGQG